MEILSTPVGTKDDSCTFLVRIGNEFGIRWAGCLYGPTPDLSKLVKDDLLAECQTKLADPATVWKPQTLADGGDLGPILESDFV